MSSTGVTRRVRLALGAAALAAALAAVGLVAGTHTSFAQTVPAPLAPGDTPAAPTDTATPSYAPANPVDCTDPNNAINCQTPPVDSPLVVGPAAPGSPFRD